MGASKAERQSQKLRTPQSRSNSAVTKTLSAIRSYQSISLAIARWDKTLLTMNRTAPAKDSSSAIVSLDLPVMWTAVTMISDTPSRLAEASRM